MDEICRSRRASASSIRRASVDAPEVPGKLDINEIDMVRADSRDPQWAASVTKSLQRIEAKIGALEKSVAAAVGEMLQEHLGRLVHLTAQSAGELPAPPRDARLAARTQTPAPAPLLGTSDTDKEQEPSVVMVTRTSAVMSAESLPVLESRAEAEQHCDEEKPLPADKRSSVESKSVEKVERSSLGLEAGAAAAAMGPATSSGSNQPLPRSRTSYCVTIHEEQGWPANLERRKEFLQGHRIMRNQVTMLQILQTRQSKTDQSNASSDDGSLGRRGRWAFLVLDPESRKIKLHGRLVTLAMIFDLVVMPYVIAWEVPFEGWLEVCGWLSAAIWAVDLILGFFTGQYREGELDLRLGHIGWEYFKGLFLPNFLALVADLLSLSLAITWGHRHLIRIVSVLRLYRLQGLSDGLIYRSLTDRGRMLMQGARLFLAILWVNHVLCCTWYFIGRLQDVDTGGSWFDTMRQENAEGLVVQFENLGETYAYFTAFHWTLSQLTAGGLERIAPLNSLERAFNIFCLIFGLIFMSSLVSLLSATMTQIFMQRQDQVQKLRELRQFLIQKSVTPRMQLRVQRQVAERLGKKKKLTDNDVPALALLSSNLRSELRYEILQKQIMKHPLLRLCDGVDLETVQSLCGEGIELRLLTPGDNLFEFGQPANDGMYHISAGKLRYTLKSVYARNHFDVHEDVKERSWLCEAALWTSWFHTGTAQATDPCELLVLPAEKALSLLFKHATIRDLVAEYSRHFHQRVVSAASAFVPPPTDLRVPFTEYSDIVWSMDRETQAMIGEMALHEAVARGIIDHKNVAAQKAEVQDGAAIAILNDRGEPESCVHYSVLRVDRGADNFVLTQVGTLAEDGTATPVIQFPRVKQARGEMPVSAVKRLLSELKQLVQDVEIVDYQRNNARDSHTAGLPMRHWRTTFLATVDTTAKVSAKLLPIRSAIESGSMGGNSQNTGDHINGSTNGAVGIGTAFVQEEADDLAKQYKVYLITQGNGEGILYAWLPEHEVDHLSEDAEGIDVVQCWLKQLEGIADVLAPPITKMRDAFKTRSISAGTLGSTRSKRSSSHKSASSGRASTRETMAASSLRSFPTPSLRAFLPGTASFGIMPMAMGGQRNAGEESESLERGAGSASMDVGSEGVASDQPAERANGQRVVRFGPLLPSPSNIIPGSIRAWGS